MSSYLFHMFLLIGCESDGHFVLVQSPDGLLNPGVRFGLSAEEAEETEGLWLLLGSLHCTELDRPAKTAWGDRLLLSVCLCSLRSDAEHWQTDHCEEVRKSSTTTFPDQGHPCFLLTRYVLCSFSYPNEPQMFTAEKQTNIETVSVDCESKIVVENILWN